jgi:hypothetical protein
VIGLVSKPPDDTPSELVTRAAIADFNTGKCHAPSGVQSLPCDLDGARARKRLMLGVLALIAAGAVVVAEPALSAGPVMSPSAGAPPPKAPGAILPGGGAPTVGVPTVVAPQVPLGASALPTTTAPKGFPTGGGVPTAINPIPGIDVVVRKKPSGSAMKLQTDGKGGFTLGDLTPGEYVIELPVDSLRSAVDRLDAKQLPGGTGTSGAPSAGGAPSLPAVQQQREAGRIRVNFSNVGIGLVEHTFTGTTTGGTPHIQFTITTVAVGTDTTPTTLALSPTTVLGGTSRSTSSYVSTIDWGDGSPSMIFDRWGNLISRLPNAPGGNAAVAPNNPGGGTTGPDYKKHSYKGIVTLVR